jgi:hypothetical protein
MYSKHLKNGQVWFSNGGFQLELAILIPYHFLLPSCYNHLKTGKKVGADKKT